MWATAVLPLPFTSYILHAEYLVAEADLYFLSVSVYSPQYPSPRSILPHACTDQEKSSVLFPVPSGPYRPRLNYLRSTEMRW